MSNRVFTQVPHPLRLLCDAHSLSSAHEPAATVLRILAEDRSDFLKREVVPRNEAVIERLTKPGHGGQSIAKADEFVKNMP